MTDLLPNGIYFGLPEETYLSQERLSKSGIKRIRVSPADFWAESYLNPNPPELTPEQERQRFMARLVGRAYHAARLEPEKFASTYVREISMADFSSAEGFVSSGREIEALLAERGQPKKSKDDAGVLDQAKRLAATGYDGPIWHIEEEKWRASVLPGQVVIPAKVYQEILVDMERIRRVPSVQKLLTGGIAEVSIFWTCPETGIPMKARFDYLKPDRWVEFKTFANSSRKALFQAITDAIRFERYHIDAAAYMECAEIVRGGTLDIIGDATAEERELVGMIQARAEPLRCHFIFQQKGGVANLLNCPFHFFESPSDDALRELEESCASDQQISRARKMQAISSRHRTAIYTKGRMEIAAAKRDFLLYSEVYQAGEPWAPIKNVLEISDASFSQHFLEEEI